MLVPAMNQQEVNAEILRDETKWRASTFDRLLGEYARERKKLKIDKAKTFPRCYPIKTAAKNNWLIFIEKSHGSSRYKDESDLVGGGLVYYYNTQGLRVFRPQETFMEVFNGHFFTRYNQRMGLNLPYQVDVIKTFVKNSGYLQPEVITKPDGEKYTLSVCREGLALGRYYDGDPSWLVHRTFISNDLKTSKQLLEQQRLLLQMQHDITLRADETTSDGIRNLRYEQGVANHILGVAV